MREFLITNDIERWSSAFLDPSWTHEVIKQTEVDTLSDFYSLMFQTRNVRRQIVERVLKGIPIRSHFAVSLTNAKTSLANACVPSTTTVVLKASEDPETQQRARLDIADEILVG